MRSNSLLWNLQPPSGKASWIFGTMHIRDDRAYQVSHALYPLISAADAFIAEMDLDFVPHTFESRSYNMKLHVGEAAFEKARNQIRKSFGGDLLLLNHMHPLMMMNTISVSVLREDHMISLDEHLWKYAKELGKPLSGLESFEEQFKILHEIPPEPLYRQIIKMAEKPWTARKQSAVIMHLYTHGDIHGLYQHSRASMQHLRKPLIYRRNKNMSSVITQLDTSLSYFITVGAGHLSGAYGLIRLLKKAGWRIKPHFLS